MSFVQPPYWAYERGGLRGWPQHVGLSVITPPVGEPLTLDEAKAHVKVDGPESDAELTRWISAARLDVEVYTSRACLTQNVDVTLSRFPWARRAIEIPIAPLQRVTGIDYLNASGDIIDLDPTLYAFDAPQGPYAAPGRVMLAYGQYAWPYPPAMEVLNGVTIHCVVGYGDTGVAVPAALTAAMLLLIANWWLNREAGAIIRGSADVLPYGVDRLLQPFRQETLA
ncbi:MAG TPA: hypothetical protein VGQ44_01475 [Gemmatimonadaceae bacterium]|jgi:uncharacterized phiE125 gp8 family phage protein|nr:hypothetical protein [Gemmatimonadaceae bacterium]